MISSLASSKWLVIVPNAPPRFTMFPMLMSQLTSDNAPIASPTFAKDDVTASNLLATPSSIVSKPLILLICLADSVNSFLAIARFCDNVPK